MSEVVLKHLQISGKQNLMSSIQMSGIGLQIWKLQSLEKLKVSSNVTNPLLKMERSHTDYCYVAQIHQCNLFLNLYKMQLDI